MSLRGIESQMIVNRTSDYARDASVQIRRGELAQDYLAHQNKVLADMQKDQVAELEGKEAARIRLDERKEAEQGEKKKKKKKAQPSKGAQAASMGAPTVGSSPERLLDIEV